jgi:hypothetical protein
MREFCNGLGYATHDCRTLVRDRTSSGRTRNATIIARSIANPQSIDATATRVAGNAMYRRNVGNVKERYPTSIHRDAGLRARPTRRSTPTMRSAI